MKIILTTNFLLKKESLLENQLQNDTDFKEKFEIYKESNLFLKTKFSTETNAFKENLKAIAKESYIERNPKKER